MSSVDWFNFSSSPCLHKAQEGKVRGQPLKTTQHELCLPDYSATSFSIVKYIGYSFFQYIIEAALVFHSVLCAYTDENNTDHAYILVSLISRSPLTTFRSMQKFSPEFADPLLRHLQRSGRPHRSSPHFAKDPFPRGIW